MPYNCFVLILYKYIPSDKPYYVKVGPQPVSKYCVFVYIYAIIFLFTQSHFRISQTIVLTMKIH